MKDLELYAVSQELKWREYAEAKLPVTDNNQRRLNYLRERYKQLKEEEKSK